jgi:hypothetical protein
VAFAVLLYYTCLPDAEAYITHFVTSSQHKILEIAHTHIHKRIRVAQLISRTPCLPTLTVRLRQPKAVVLLSDSPISFT